MLALALALLLLPECPAPMPEGAGRAPFVWDRDALWQDLERRFVAAKERGCPALGSEIDAGFQTLGSRLAALASEPPGPEDAALGALENELFALAPLVAACSDRVGDLVALFTRVRAVVKDASRSWDVGSEAARRRVYRLLYGGRAAVEEVLLQLPRERVPALTPGTDEPSASPGAEHFGVRVRSGDILVSRGGAPTSALIARGSDFPGNFSHVALLHVDESTGSVTVVESHIESGVGLSSLEEYVRDKKLRVMVLRPRSDLPAVVADPLLPHRAASEARAEAGRRHVPYDFEMDYGDPGEQFCSEVASSAYGRLGVDLWQGLTSMSSGGVTRWLASLGVRHFETYGPSDLEYDPQLVVVAEWRDPETLFQDHVDNAVIDALLEGAEVGEEIGYSRHLLPVARLTKAYSVARNLLGGVGPIPEGMTATVALRVQWLGERHAAIKERALELAEDFREEQGYTAPYWTLVDLARRAKSEIDGGR
jgi:hypothetical protein